MVYFKIHLPYSETLLRKTMRNISQDSQSSGEGKRKARLKEAYEFLLLLLDILNRAHTASLPRF